MSKRNIKLYLDDIQDATDKIESYTSNISLEKFRNDTKTIDAVIRNIEIIGEAARHIPEDVRLKFPEVPWSLMIGARNKAIHEYFGVDTAILWQTIKEDIPLLKKVLKAM